MRLHQLLQRRPVDPFTLLAPHLSTLRTELLNLLLLPTSTHNAALGEITKYYFQHPSKQVRPVLVLLFSQATNGLGQGWSQKWEESNLLGLNRPFSDEASLSNNPTLPETTPPTPPTLRPLPTQLRLAQIVEMVHTASLLHDDVIDKSTLRRGAPSAPSAFGNKSSVLGGNFILGRASEALARLGDPEVTELIASVLANLVDGEMLQMKRVKMETKMEQEKSPEAWNVYLQKTYLKTASLMAKGARAAVVLGGCREGEIYKEIAYAYGRNLGIAFQLVDDVLDYEHASSTLGKPGGADLNLGLATGPALYACEEHPEMAELIYRKFERPGDVELARDYVLRSSGVQRTRALAQAYADKAKEVLAPLPESDAKACLELLTERVIGRKS